MVRAPAEPIAGEKIRVPGCTAPHLLGDGKWASAARTVTHLRHAGLSRDVGRGKLTLVAYDFATGRRALELEPLARLPLGGVLAGQLSVPLGAGAAVVSEVTAASNERPRRVRVVDERGDELAQPVVVRSRPWRAVCTQNPAVFTIVSVHAPHKKQQGERQCDVLAYLSSGSAICGPVGAGFALSRSMGSAIANGVSSCYLLSVRRPVVFLSWPFL